jgi:hypothetical protein
MDRHLHVLYGGLTEEEIKIVEGKLTGPSNVQIKKGASHELSNHHDES